jgi:hypothetical protein
MIISYTKMHGKYNVKKTVFNVNLSLKQFALQLECTQTYFTVYFKNAYEGENV